MMKIKPETAENVILGEIGVALVLIGFLVAALVASREKPRAQERITIMKVRPVSIDPHARIPIPEHPAALHLIVE